MLIIPLQPVATQTLSVVLEQQQTTLSVYQAGSSLYMDVAVNNAPIVSGVICQQANVIVRDAYLGFAGDLAFFDTQGTNDPQYDGLGTRYILGYFDLSELPAGVS